MKKHGVFFIGLFLFAVSWLGAEPFMVISAGDPLLDDLRFAARSAGKSFLSLTPPLSRDEVLWLLDDLESGTLPASAWEACERVRRSMVPARFYDSPLFSAAIHVNGALEGRLRSNTDVPWLKRDTESQALLGLPIGLYFVDKFQIFFEPIVATDPWYYNHPVSNAGTNVPWEAERFDLNLPLRAFAAGGGKWWAFQIGRDRISYGLGHTGNLAVSDTPDYYDFARLSLFNPVLKYSFLVSQMPMNAEEFSDPERYAAEYREEDIVDTTNRYFYFHRFDLRFFKKFSLGISEGAMVASPLELRYLNPITIYHSFYAWRDYPEWGNSGGYMAGSIFSVDFEWALHPGWALYGQMVMTEFSTQYELDNFPDQQPPQGLGFLLGLDYALAVRNWRVSLYGEVVYTDPFLYILSSPFNSMVWMRRSSDLGNKDLRYSWIGHSAGRDVFLAALGARAEKGKLALALDAECAVHGKHGLFWDWEKPNTETSPSGNPETTFKVDMTLAYKLFPFLTLSGYIGGALVFDAGHVMGRVERGIEAGLKAAYYY
jgi:hypothetical protein